MSTERAKLLWAMYQMPADELRQIGIDRGMPGAPGPNADSWELSEWLLRRAMSAGELGELVKVIQTRVETT